MEEQDAKLATGVGMRRASWMTGCAALVIVLITGQAFAATDTSCSDNHEPWSYEPQPQDAATSTHLEAHRAVPELRSLQVHLCSGELRLVPASLGHDLGLLVETSAGGKPPSAYLQTLSAKDGAVVITLQTPKAARAVVTIFVPAQAASAATEVDLGAGTLRLERNALRGERKLNLGAGQAYLLLNGDHDYSHLQTNIGMGRLVDDRPSGHGGFLIVSRSTEGTGEGSLEVNVGAGSIHLEPVRRP